MAAGIDVATLAGVKFAYPTYSAIIGNAARGLLRAGAAGERPRRRLHPARPTDPGTLGGVTERAPLSRKLPCPNCHRRVGDPQGRRQGEGPAGRRPPGHQLCRRRARLRDARIHRGCRGRRAARPRELPLHAGGRPARAARGHRGQDAARLRPRGRRLAGHRHQRRQAGRLPGVPPLLNPGDEVLLPTPYWTTYPEAIRLAGGVPVDVFAGADQNYLVTVEQLEAARTDRTTVLLFVSPSNPTGSVYSPEQTRAIGEWALEQRPLGHHRRDLPEPRLRGRPRRLDRRGRPGRSPARRSSSTASPRPMP